MVPKQLNAPMALRQRYPLPISYARSLSTSPRRQAYMFSSTISDEDVLSGRSMTLLVFLNGRDIPMSEWNSCLRSHIDLSQRRVAILAYDRFGQGLSPDRHPKDVSPRYNHDLKDAVLDLEEIIEYALLRHLGINEDLCDTEDVTLNKLPRIILIAHSVGCQLAQLFTQCHPHIVSGIIFLDPSPQSKTGEFMSLLPDPDASEFSEKDLPTGVSVAAIKVARELLKTKGKNLIRSEEGLTLENISTILPMNSPYQKLIGRGPSASVNSCGPFLTILMHSAKRFADNQNQDVGVPQVIYYAYEHPFWEAFCARLGEITDRDKLRGPIVLEDTGHMIMVDNPRAVVAEIQGMMEMVQNAQ